MSVLENGRTRRWQFEKYNPLIIPITNKYPTFKDAMNMVEDVYKSCSFSKVFSIDEDFDLMYKNRHRIGKLDNHGEPQLLREFMWLDEALKEDTERA